MNPTLDLSGIDRISQGLAKLGDPDATPLMLAWMKIMENDNRTGILQGLDKDGVPMIPVKYRPKLPGPARTTTAQRGGRSAKAKRGVFQGLGATNYGNLASSEYRLLGGPPLAPRGQFSRVITNYKTDFAKLRRGYWQATFWWDEVVSTLRVPFLHWHFTGTAKLPRRDLRGIRPDGRQKVLAALTAWAKDALRQAFGRSG